MSITSLLKAIAEKAGLYEEPSPEEGREEGSTSQQWGGVPLGVKPKASAPPAPLKSGPCRPPHFSADTVSAALHSRERSPEALKSFPHSPAQSLFYTVKPGDNLWKIAEAQYGPGQGEKNHLIYEANRPILASPEHVYPGQVLRIPSLS